MKVRETLCPTVGGVGTASLHRAMSGDIEWQGNVKMLSSPGLDTIM